MKQIYISIIAISLLLLSGCGGDVVPMEIIDQNQIISQQNAEMNARAFKNGRYPDAVRITIDSDSTIGPDCRYGDGWASGKLYFKKSQTISIICQTTGRGKGFSGCLTKKDFVNKPYGKQDGDCDETITALKKFK